MRIALVDDNEEQLQSMYSLVDSELSCKGDSLHKITVFKSGEEFLAAWECGIFDLVILDIYMGGMTGIDVAYEIRKTDSRVLLAFCTTSNEFASESFDVGAKHYLRKPITAEGVSKMFARLNLDEIEKNRITKLPDGYNVKLRDIIYTEYANHAVTVFIKNEKPHRFRVSHTVAEEHLMPHGYFFAPCKGIILNFYEVAEFDEKNGIFKMKDGNAIPVVRRKLKEAKDAYANFLFNKMKKDSFV